MQRLFLSGGILSLALIAFTAPLSARSASGDELELTIVQLRYFHQFQFAGYYAAIEQGYYREVGLKVLLKEATAGLNVTDEVVEGRAQFGIGMTSLLLDRNHGKPVVVLAAIFQHSPLVVLSRAESGISTVHDLVGRRVMIRSSDDAQTPALLLSEGISLAQIQLVEHTFDYSDLIEGNVDAATAYITVQPYLLLEQGVSPRVIRPQNYGIDFYGDCLFTSEQELRRHPERVKAFRAASVKGWAYAMGHKDELIELIATKYRPPITRERLSYEAQAMEEIIVPQLVDIGHMNAGRWQHIADVYVKAGMLDPDYSLEGLLYSPAVGLDHRWLRRVLGLALASVALIGTVAFALLLFNRRLRSAVEQRTIALSKANTRLRAEVQERKQASQALQESELRFRDLFENSPDAIFVEDSDGNVLDVNPAACRLHQLERKNLVGMHVSELVPANMRQDVSQSFSALSEGRLDSLEGVSLTTNGEAVPVEIRSSPMEFAGKPAVLLHVRDATVRKRAEDGLRQQLHWMEVLTDISRSIVRRNDIRSILKVIMQHLEKSFSFALGTIGLLGAQKEAYVSVMSSRGRALATHMDLEEGDFIPLASDLIHQMEANQVNTRLLAEISSNDLSEPSQRMLQVASDNDLKSMVVMPFAAEGTWLGSVFMFFSTVASISEYEQGFLHGVAESLSVAVQNRKLYEDLEHSYNQLKDTQKALMEQERLNAMGQMASGIAHDINNTLVPITLYTDVLLESEVDVSDWAKQCLQTVKEAAKDIENTTMRLRKFYRRQEEETAMQLLDVKRLLDQVLELARPRWEDMPQREGMVIDIRSEIADGQVELYGNESEIREALINLVFNAVDALPQGGSITVRVDRREQQVSIEVIDTGTGMSEEQRQRCQEPFFTTKGERGTGLGLSTVYGTMQRHAGEMEVDSQVGQGTSIRLLFPVPGHQLPEPSEAQRVDFDTDLRILCIDDDSTVRKSLMKTLQREGYAVEVADSGSQGVQKFSLEARGKRPFDLVITDLGMPHMDGKQVACEIKRLSADTPVILLSGWGNLMQGDQEVPPEIDCVLGKPSSVGDLRSAIHRAVQG